MWLFMSVLIWALFYLPNMSRLNFLLYGYPKLLDNNSSELPVKLIELPILNSYEFPVIARISFLLHGSHENPVKWLERVLPTYVP